jgi:hypothetical protein
MVLLLAATVSASLTVSPQSIVFTQAEDSEEITIDSDTVVDVSFTLPSIEDLEENEIAFDAMGDVSVNLSETVNLVVSDLDYSNLYLSEDYSGELLITDKANASNNVSIPVSFKKDYCEYGEGGKIAVSVKDLRLDNEDRWEWKPLDEIEIEVKANDLGSGEDKDVVIVVDLYDKKENEFIGIDDGDEIEEDISIEDGKSEEVNFLFKVPEETERSAKGARYLLYVKVYEDGFEEDFCASVIEEVEIERESYEVKVESFEFPDFVNCGDTAELVLDIANIGTHDERQVKIELIDNELGWDDFREIKNLDWDDKPETVSFVFRVPKDAEEKTYDLRFDAYLKYDTHDDEYDRNRKGFFTGELKVQGNCIVEQTMNALITADLDSDPIAGEQLVVKGEIENTGEEETTYSIDVSGLSSWAELDEIKPSTITLEKGESEEFLIYLNVDEDAVGEQFFTIEADYDGETTEQDVSIVIEGKTAGITGSVIGEHLRENWFIWVIVLINIILIIAIIVVARRIVSAR